MASGRRKKIGSRPSSSPAATEPVLMVRKPGGGMRFCIDNRALSAVTSKNRYPIPLINETLGKLSSAVRFTKLDIIHAFNRIQMKKGYEWLTSFNTGYGQFEYLVIPVRLCHPRHSTRGGHRASAEESTRMVPSSPRR